ncbi:hypothetical protein [Homoserinibacter sp. YIM 151385]|uniref:hypothetical protein n=1 Tax=Homoserinibacter sp. YIM 151385 TaxID=2985506 RepID=UPI0022F03088|nr:hypothetical protein [Homoserinibacter sp. YIM 151385]WBU38365.1 hypothetical protein OF852_01920 [Homoserinibacter sp. YIM 151385]
MDRPNPDPALAEAEEIAPVEEDLEHDPVLGGDAPDDAGAVLPEGPPRDDVDEAIQTGGGA